jgi:hypothetical protein
MNLNNKLQRIRALIEGGWTQFQFVDGINSLSQYFDPAEPVDGRCFCITGAVGIVESEYPSSDQDTIVALAAQLPADFLPSDEADDRLENWNDDPRRTQAEVLDLIDRAIAANP